VTELVALMRFVHVASCSLFVGSGAFDLLVATPARRPHGMPATEASLGGERSRRRLASWSLGLASASAVAWLMLECALMSGRPFGEAVALPILGTVLARTVFGHVWTVRLGLFLMAGVILLRARHGRTDTGRPVWESAGALLGGLALALLAWVGHAGGGEGGSRSLTLGSDAVHLLATGVWLGGLLPLCVSLWHLQGPTTTAAEILARRVVHRFSALAFGCVASLVLTGSVNTWVLVGSVPALIGTPYGHLLLIKLALVGLVLAVAALNRYWLVPSLAASGAVPALRPLARSVLLETTIGAGILLLVGYLGITPPARHEEPVWPFAFRLSWISPADVPGGWVALLVASLGVLLGLLALAYGVRQRQQRLWVVLLGAALLGGYGIEARRFVAVVDAYPTTYRRSPVAYEVTAIARGRQLYHAQCALCHGVAGHGDGAAGQALRPRPADLTGPHLGHHTAGDLYWWLTHGIPGTAMPGFAERLSETDRWDVITFLRTLAAAEQASRLSPHVDPMPWVIAPNFTFTTTVGTQETLKEQRGKAVVLVVLFSLPGSREHLVQLAQARDALASAGTQVILVPMRMGTPAERQVSLSELRFPVAADESPEIAAAYTLLRRTAAESRIPPALSHVEFLVDRQGYIRARWNPREGSGWESVAQLLEEIDRLNKEPLRTPASDEHAH
jgi:putative copper resistance protein D